MNLFSFHGRISRLEWWLAAVVLSWLFAIMCFSYLISVYDAQEISDHIESPLNIYDVIFLIVSLPVTWIGIAANAKRFHDLDKSGWWQLIWFIPCIGSLVLYVMLGFLSGGHGRNRFGRPDNGSVFAESNGIFGESNDKGGSGGNSDNQTRLRKDRTNTTGLNQSTSNKPVFGKRTNSPPIRP